MPPKKVITKPLMRLRLHEEIVPILQKQIMNGTIKTGTKLPPERELAQTFNVNRTTLREALRKLETLELVEIRQGDGVYAKNYLDSGNLDIIKVALDVDESNKIIFNLLEGRRYVLPEMAYVAAQRRTAADLAAIKQAIFKDDLPMQEKDIKVQRLIARATQNILFTVGLNFFTQIFRDHGYLFYEEARHVERCRTFHLDIYEAIKSKKPEDARRIMLDAIIYGEDAMKIFLTKKK